jgi:NodT family efflux transporter outer membrane factor (OMF) lipoprotein
MRRLLVALTACGLALCACAVGPNYRQPPALPHADGGFVSAATAGATAAAPRDDWWRLYDDPTLDSLIQKAFAANTDLRRAEANLALSRATLSEARSGLFPTTTLSAGATYGRSASGNSAAAAAAAEQQALTNVPGANPAPFGPTTAHANWVYQAGFDMNYEVDLFGRVRRTIEAARADAQSVEAARDAVLITVVSDVVRTYVDGCAYAQQLNVAERNLKLAQSTYDLTTLQFNAGALSALEQARAQTVLEQARATIPTLEGNRAADLFALAALLGVSPKDAPQEATRCTAPPRLTSPIPVGDGAALLARRPDVREAERTLAAETARIGIATADLYPSISLGGSVGAAGLGSNMFSYGASTFGLGPLISWNFPNILAARARIREAKASTQAALASFDGTMLTALKETEQALATYGGELRRNAALVRARDASKTAYSLIQSRFSAGTISQLDLITAEQTLISAEQSLAASDQSLADDQVAVFKALGGGWQGAPVPKL